MINLGNSKSVPIKTKLVLAFYGAGIIVGGGILALPFVAIDSGLLFLILSLVFLAFLFSIIYWRILDSVALATTEAETKANGELGLVYYDLALEASNLGKWGRVAFSTGLILYVIPADIVYILYGMKSIIQLSKYFIDFKTIPLTLAMIILFIALILTHVFKDEPTPSKTLAIKLLIMSAIWSLSIAVATTFGEIGFTIGIIGFSLSVIVGEFFPEKFFGGVKNNVFEIESGEVLPRHKAQAYLTFFKIFLIISVPILALIIIYLSKSLPSPPPLFPRKLVSFADSISVIMFMYVGSGVYNILIYPWILKNLDEGKRLVFYSVLVSLIAYLVFSIIIVSVVDYKILVLSDLRREHSFISLSRKLEAIGFSLLAYLTIALASLFALVSVAVAYIGFTDTLSERLVLDLGVNRDKIWIVITAIVSTIVASLEFYNVSRAATDSLGIAGNAGGGLFLVFLPWLMRGRNSGRRIGLAVVSLIFVIIINLAIILNATTLYAIVSGVISTILVILVGILSILEASKK